MASAIRSPPLPLAAECVHAQLQGRGPVVDAMSDGARRSTACITHGQLAGQTLACRAEGQLLEARIAFPVCAVYTCS